MQAITAAQSAAMLAETRRIQAEFDQWAAGVLDGTVRLTGDELAAYRAGWRAGRLRLEDAAQADFTARQIVAWSKGYGEGRAGSQATPAELDAHEARVAALLHR